MSASASLRSPHPAEGRRTPFAQEDLAGVFDARLIQRGRTLLLMGAVQLGAAEHRIEATVRDAGRDLAVTIAPLAAGRRIVFDRNCGCGRRACAHMAAAAMLALEARPEWRRPVQADLPGLGTGADVADRAATLPPRPARQHVAADIRPIAPRGAPDPVAAPASARLAVWTLEAASGDAAMFVTAHLAEAEGALAADRTVPATPRQVLESAARNAAGDFDRSVARLLGGGDLIRTPVPKNRRDAVDMVLKRLVASGRLRWRDGTALVEGERRIVRVMKDGASGKVRPLGLPAGGALIKGTRWWYVDPASGRLGLAELRIVPTPERAALDAAAVPRRRGREVRPRPETPEIVARDPRIVLRIERVATPHDGVARVLRLAFDYGEPDRPAEIDPEDQRQFARAETATGAALFVRRNRELEAAALGRLAQAGFAQLRIDAAAPGAKGVRVHGLRGPDAAERWDAFSVELVPALLVEGWSIEDNNAGIRVVEPDGEIAMAVEDQQDGWFDLEIGVEIDGERQSLLPILAKLVAAGGMDVAQISEGRLLASLEDGRVLALPADRMARVMSVLQSLLEAGTRRGDQLRVPVEEADALLDVEDLVGRRGFDDGPIGAYLQRLRDAELTGDLPELLPPPSFRGELRAYQRQGLGWLQRLRSGGMAGILADDMGLGKTAQTLAHIALEHAEGRLAGPCLVVVPTSLVPNWVSEAAKFTPGLDVLVLHGQDRHERRHAIDDAHIVVTTYAVLARDLAFMRRRRWYLVILDEAQAIKNPGALVTRAVCSLDAIHRLCLSGTPVENSLEELWSQFAFLMPGLLGDRKSFQKRFRTPIEKRGDATRAALLSRRIRPFLLRRTKDQVATELPPKTEIVTRVELEPAQRDLYETIRLSVSERVRDAIERAGLARSTITVLDALLKLRQACCDPRLVKVEAPREIEGSAKLTCLIEMLKEMIPEGRRILVFSQFTSMLDLIKPELDREGIAFLELTGSTRDRGEPVRRFQAGEAPVFLISLKAGGRGLNLTAADAVIHYDPWWNPAAEDQATDRAHRIGQDKPVFVYKLIAAGTVEERILDLQRRKANLADATIDGGGLSGALAEGDVDYLFAPDAATPDDARIAAGSLPG